ncbi:MAG: tetratricopeptide repeat protein [Candidatus Eremiobacteraeota bacterium]|nr:tetratricopeptide repeat protein [Candidatus Eremiobacteraeota bacterium]
MATAQPNNEGKSAEGATQRVGAMLAQARQHLIRNNAAAALTLLKEIANLPDCPADVRLDAAKMLGTAGANAEAAQCYLNAGLGLLYDLGDMARARQAFASAHNLDPHNLDVIFHLGQADVVEGRTQDGLAKFIDVLRKSNLKHTPALFEAGCIYQANGQYDQAILAFKKVLDREKDHIQAIVHMGQLHQIKGMIPEAIGYYLQAAQITRDAQQLGTTRQIVNMVLALDGNNARARSTLADLDDKSDDEEGEQQADGASAAAPEKTVAAWRAQGPQAEPAAKAPPAAPKQEQPAPTAPAPARKADQSSAASAAASADVARLRQEQSAAEAALMKVRAELDALAQEREAAKAELAAKRSELERKALAEVEASVAAQREAAKAELAAKRSELERKALAEIEASVATKREAAQRELADLQAQLEQARAQSAEASSTRDAIAAATAELDEKLQRLQQQVADTEARRSQASSAVATSVSELERKAKALKADVAREEARLKEAQAQAAQMQGNLSKAQTAQEAAMLEIAARRQRAQADLEKVQAEVARVVREKDAERERAGLTVADLDAKAEQLRKEIGAAEKLRKEAETKAAAAQTAFETLDARMTTAKAKSDTAAADLKDIVDQTRSAQANSADLAARLADLQSAIEQAESKKRVLEDSIGKVKPLAASAEKRRLEAESAAEQAEKKRTKQDNELKTIEAKKRELEEAFAKLKSLGGAAEQRKAQAEAAAEQAEALRAKREADAEALAARIATLESTLQDADARAKASAAEGVALSELSEKVSEQRSAVLALETKKAETERTIAQLRTEIEALRKTHEEAQADANVRTLQHQTASRDSTTELDAEAVAAFVPAETCVESLRTIETMAADGELSIDAATELAGLIHEGRGLHALREARKRANLEAKPGPYLLVCGDLCRDLGDVAAARAAYRTLALADPGRSQLVHARVGDLFLTFAERSTAAALQRDDAHFAAAGDPAKAIETYAELVARFPDDPSFREELGALHERLGNTSAAALAYTQAMVGYLGGDDVVHAVELAPKLLASQPNEGSAYELAARAFDRAGRNAEAHSALDQALRAYHDQHAASDVERVCRHLAEVAEDPVPYRRELAGLLREAGDNAGAAEQLLEAAEKLIGWSRGSDAAQLLKEADTIAGDDEMVKERIRALTARASDVQRSVDDIARGDLLVGKEQYERAAEAYRRAIDENPHHAGAAYRLACLLMDHFHEYENAEELLQTASELRPDHAATRYRLALVKAARGYVVEAVELLIALARFDEANADFIEQFAERLEKDAEGGDVTAKYRLGIGYRELGRVDEALVILQSIQREADYVVLCHNAIGLCLRRQGLDTAAAKRFTKAIETPGYPESQYHEALYNLGELYEAKNTAESLALALASFEELYASDCTFKAVGDRIKAVKARMGAADRPKVKRLPTRTADQA